MRPSRLAELAAVGVVLTLVGFALAGVEPKPDQVLAERRAVLDRTETLLDSRYEQRAQTMTRRVRAYYKATRASAAPLWIDPGPRAAVLRQRGGFSRILARDLHELGVLREELVSVSNGRERIASASGQASTEIPVRSLVRPVPGAIIRRFGRYRDRRSKSTVVRQGVELATRVGAPVKAVAGGVVKYVGPVRGLGQAVVIEHAGGVRSLLGPLQELLVEPGRRLLRDEVIGLAADGGVYLELRLNVGPEGLPVDPTALLAPR